MSEAADRASWRRVVVVSLLALAALTAGGCGIAAHANRPLNPMNRPLEARQQNHTRAAVGAKVDLPREQQAEGPAVGPRAAPEPPPARPWDANGDGYFVGVAVSGGGSRSANFSAACFFHLQRLGLLRHVDYVSSVSGGSLTAAYYCVAADDEWNPGRVQETFTHSFAGDVIAQTLMPWNTAALMFTPFDRADLLANSFRREVFTRGGRELTYGDLRPDRPRLLINATDLQSGRRFVFCDEAFDQLNSDLSRYPLAYAVTASAAMPVALHHVTLRDYSTRFKQYRHLIDGGVTDNLGVQSLVETYAAHLAAAKRAGPHRPDARDGSDPSDPYPGGAILIVVDATTKFDATISSQADTDFFNALSLAAGLSSTALVNRASSATLAELIVRNAADRTTAKDLRAAIDTLKDTGYLKLNDRTGHPVRIVHIALPRVDDLDDLPFQSFQHSVNNIATYFAIDDTEAFHLYQAADLLVEKIFEPKLREIVRELEGAGGGK